MADITMCSGEEWQKRLPKPRVLDPDGWDRQNYQYSWFEEEITFAEYVARLHKRTRNGIIPTEGFKTLTDLEAADDAAEREFPLVDTEWCRTGAAEEENLQLRGHRRSFIKGAQWQAQRMYSDEEVGDILIHALHSAELKHGRNYTKVYEEMKDPFQKNREK